MRLQVLELPHVVDGDRVAGTDQRSVGTVHQAARRAALQEFDRLAEQRLAGPVQAHVYPIADAVVDAVAREVAQPRYVSAVFGASMAAAALVLVVVFGAAAFVSVVAGVGVGVAAGIGVAAAKIGGRR
jgi:hypothetical protein